MRLSNNKLAVATEPSPLVLLQPVVTAFYALRHQERQPPQRVDLSAPGRTVRIVTRQEPAAWSFADLDDIWVNALRG